MKEQGREQQGGLYMFRTALGFGCSRKKLSERRRGITCIWCATKHVHITSYEFAVLIQTQDMTS
jgi:hypothetical protein